jgi:hypothetical protein
MSKDNFRSLLEKVKPLIEKEDTVLRTAVTVEKRLVITIRFLVFCNNFSTGALQNYFRNVQNHLFSTQETVTMFTD